MRTELASAKVRLSDELGHLPEREELLKPCEALLKAFASYAGGLVPFPHPTKPENWPKSWPFFDAGWHAAVAAERERCAKLCRGVAAQLCEVYGDNAECIATGDACAAAIRGTAATSESGLRTNPPFEATAYESSKIDALICNR